MAAKNQQHFVVVPNMAQGHINRALGLSRLFAERGALVSVISTPVNAARNKPALDRLAARGLSVRLVELRFPCAEVGLPDGCESFDLLPSPALFGTFYEATRLLETQIESYIREEERDHRRPTCMVSDMVLPWTAGVAERLRMPRLLFHGPPCFTLLCMHCILKQNVYDRAAPEDAPIRAVVPGLPRPLEIVKGQAKAFTSDEFLDEALAAESTADGVVVNTFEELEGWFVHKYREETGMKVWTVGPASTLGTEGSNVGQNKCTEWLDSMEPGSVMYVNFGSIVVTPPSQLMEMGLGLEASGCPFLLVVKEKEIVEEVKEWLEGGFEERTKERGFILKGWAPQAMILSHRAIGGFWTHCGWNSVLECVVAGLPMIAWPQFGDQHLNSRLLTDVLRIGVRPEAKGPGMLKSSSLTKCTADRHEIEEAVRRLMDRGEEGEDRRKRASEFGAKAKDAMEVGGSSYRNMTQLMEFVANHEYNN